MNKFKKIILWIIALAVFVLGMLYIAGLYIQNQDKDELTRNGYVNPLMVKSKVDRSACKSGVSHYYVATKRSEQYAILMCSDMMRGSVIKESMTLDELGL